MSRKARRADLATSRRRAIMIILLCIFLVAGVGAAVYFNRTPPLDEATLCPIGRDIESSVLVLVDTTDALTEIQKSQLLAAVRQSRETIATYGKLTILFLDADKPYQPRELVSLCNPGSPENINPLVQTESRVAKRWTDSFGKPIDEAVSELLSAPTATSSPIMEAITAATSRPDFNEQIKARRLILVSDMLQHDPGLYTQYAKDDLWRSFENSGLSGKVEANLSWTDVVVYYLRRPAAAQYQNKNNRDFWRKWLGRQGATSITFFGIADEGLLSK